MLAISPLRANINVGKEQGEMDITSFSMLGDQFADFPDFAAPVGCVLDTIGFDDLIHDGDVLPELEMDPSDFIAEFSVSARDLFDEDSSDTSNQVLPDFYEKANMDSGGDGCKNSDSETSKEAESEKSTRPAKERERTKKLSSSQAKKKISNNSNNNEGKRKTKVDWTPDLHRRFVQAVEQLGVDKAVPSRILELMGIDCLTRHNVASHLQKYRSHRKHVLAREAEAVSWSQKRQMYGVAVVPAIGGGKSKVNHPWAPPTIGFSPMTPLPIHHHHQHQFRPLHVWGHPTHHVEPQSVMSVWPKQLVPSPTWAAPPPLDPSFWHPHHQHRFATVPPVPGIPPSHVAMYKPEQSASSSQSAPTHPPFNLHPTKESIDAAIGDVLSKPWMPLPIGLKPPSMGSVMVELQRQGVPKIPPSCS